MTSKFKKGDTVICVHDTGSFKVGDQLEVEVPFTPCCGGVKFMNHPDHAYPDNFELKEVSSSPTLIMDEKEVMEAFKKFERTIFYNTSRGVVPSDLVRDLLVSVYDDLGIKEKMIY